MIYTESFFEMLAKISAKTGRTNEVITMHVGEEMFFEVYQEVSALAANSGTPLPVIPLDVAILRTDFGTVAVRVRKVK